MSRVDCPASRANVWLTSFKSNPTAAIRLICFPYAGGHPFIFRSWHSGLPAAVETLAVQLPGRGLRIEERPYYDVGALVRDLTDAILPSLDRPFVLFGHSLGAMLAFETSRQLRARGQPSPAHLFVSGRRAPQIPDEDPPTLALTDAEFLVHLQQLNGTAPEVLENPELLRLLLPSIRADFTMGEVYRYVDDAPLSCPITAFGGRDDPETDEGRLEAWRSQTTVHFASRLLPGDHFFLHSAEQRLLTSLADELRALAADGSGRHSV